MSERHIVVSYTPGSPIGLRVMPPDSDRPAGDSGALREAADMLAPTEATAPSGWTWGGNRVDVLDGRLVEPGRTLCIHNVGLTPGLWCGGCRDALAAEERASSQDTLRAAVEALVGAADATHSRFEHSLLTTQECDWVRSWLIDRAAALAATTPEATGRIDFNLDVI